MAWGPDLSSDVSHLGNTLAVVGIKEGYLATIEHKVLFCILTIDKEFKSAMCTPSRYLFIKNSSFSCKLV